MTHDAVTFHRRQVGDTSVFNGAAGPQDAPVLLLLHGFRPFMARLP